MKIVIASHNKGKLKEFQNILKNLNVEIVDAQSIGINMDNFEEVGTTFTENAVLKAKYVYELTGEMSIADDSGLTIHSLPDILGVYSARFMGSETDYAIKNAALLDLLKDKDDRGATFTSVIAFVGKDLVKTFEGNVHGQIANVISGEEGFGYDPIFVPNGYSQSYAEMPASVKDTMSHRALALQQFINFMENFKHD